MWWSKLKSKTGNNLAYLIQFFRWEGKNSRRGVPPSQFLGKNLGVRLVSLSLFCINHKNPKNILRLKSYWLSLHKAIWIASVREELECKGEPYCHVDSYQKHLAAVTIQWLATSCGRYYAHTWVFLRIGELSSWNSFNIL